MGGGVGGWMKSNPGLIGAVWSPGWTGQVWENGEALGCRNLFFLEVVIWELGLGAAVAVVDGLGWGLGEVVGCVGSTG
jgi:hypothetical protein